MVPAAPHGTSLNRAEEKRVALDRVTSGRKLGFWGKLKRLALTDVGALVRGLNAADVEAMERLMLEADFGLPATADMVDFLEQEIRRGRLKTEADLRAALVDHLAVMLAGPDDPGALARAAVGPTVILFPCRGRHLSRRGHRPAQRLGRSAGGTLRQRVAGR
jgi:signal recognition particle GTPase